MKRCTLLLLAGCLLFACTLAAQQTTEASRGPDGGTRTHVAGIEILPLPGQPFSGRDSVEWTRTLEDGSVQTRHLEAALARDSHGRIYRERRNFVPANTSEQSRLDLIFISDPVTHTKTTCTVVEHSCTVTGYHRPTSFVPMKPGSFDDGKRALTRESLGTSVVDDVNVVGTRETLSIGAGVVGNSQPLVVTREFWYSPELQVNLSVTRKDPREGTQTIHVVDLSRAEPDPAMFQVPAGFVVHGDGGELPRDEN
jgi:hypothetical protein